MAEGETKMKRTKGKFDAKILAVAGVVVLSIGAVYFGMKWHYGNKDQSLRNLAAAQEEVCMIVQDETWKIIKQKAQVADQYKNAFQEIFPALMEGRYGDARGGSLMSLIQESNPQFDPSLYKEISVSIEAQRHKWTNAQKFLRDVKLQHDNIRTMVPGKWFVGNVPELKVKIITSTKTKGIYEKGVEDEVNVFDR
ncbi:MAG: hypothetical protein Q8N98_01900 [bacterium]|nr:hypothetical protein [bacterium]